MSAEADRLDREAQHLEDAANEVDRCGRSMTATVSTLRTSFLQAVGNTWVGPHATRFLDLAQTRYRRLERNEGDMREVASSMRRRAAENRNRANQLRREEEERRRREQGSW
ncbi:MAG: hypothetical protein AMXMBFR80_09270 [Dehalococcoidia bacterium]